MDVLVADLHHFLDLPADAPGPTLRLAERLTGIVRAASAGDAAATWTSALPCTRRPQHRRCSGRTVVHRPEPPGPIQWWCSVCDDQGVISNWEDTPYDLRRRRLALARAVRQVLISEETATALRDLHLLDAEGERLVYAMHAQGDGAALHATDAGLEELIDSLAAEANQESDRSRRRRLDAAFVALEGEALALHDRRPHEDPQA